MDLRKKNEIVEQAILSISTHTDEDANVRKAQLGRLRDFIDAQQKKIDDEVAARVAELQA